jgi:hypothetical protein
VTAPTTPEQGVQEGPEAGPPEIDGPARPDQVRLKLKVVAGAHRGAVVLLDERDYRIGRSPDADIVLSDTGIAPTHAMLHVGRDVLRARRATVHIDATGGDIMIGREKLPLSRGRRVRLPASITIGKARVELSDAAADGVAGAIIGKTLTIVGIVASAAVASAVAVQVFRTSDPPAHARTPEHLTSGRPTGVSRADISSGFTLAADEAARGLNARLDAAKITTLHIIAENGRLAVTGTLAAQQATEWAAIHQWFDETYGGRFVLTTRIAPPGDPPAMPVLHLQAVWHGERPYVLAADGEHYFLGAVLDNGWIIKDIGENRVLLAKNGDTVVLTYGFSSPHAPTLETARTNE